jgi:hypothetical protein
MEKNLCQICMPELAHSGKGWLFKHPDGKGVLCSTERMYEYVEAAELYNAWQA